MADSSVSNDNIPDDEMDLAEELAGLFNGADGDDVEDVVEHLVDVFSTDYDDE